MVCAIRRQVARRWEVRSLLSDNRMNFMGAKGELQKELEAMDLGAVREELTRRRMAWYFNPPSAPHYGGVWELQIRTIKDVLSKLMFSHPGKLDDEGLSTLMSEV